MTMGESSNSNKLFPSGYYPSIISIREEMNQYQKTQTLILLKGSINMKIPYIDFQIICLILCAKVFVVYYIHIYLHTHE